MTGDEDILVAVSRERHGSVIDDFLRAFEEARRRYQIRRRRGTFTDPECRHFLALLLNLPGREWVLKLLQERHSDRDPVEVFLEHVTAFGSTRELGASNTILGISDFDQEHLILLEAILRGSTPAEATEALVAKLSDEEEEPVRELALKIMADLAGSDLLQSAIQR